MTAVQAHRTAFPGHRDGIHRGPRESLCGRPSAIR